MTVIAWDGKTLAADKRALNNSFASTVTKIFRADADTLIGIAGNLARGIEIMRWIAAGSVVGNFPKETTDDWTVLLVIHRDGTVEKYESREYPFVIEERFCVTGSARDFALMAMHLGHGARKAVELTCELSMDCGNGIDVLTFEE
jgi:hypothetical protein